MERKYELTNETIVFKGRTLHRIRALRPIPSISVAAGDLGGFVENDRNLSHDGIAWVYDNALVYDNARVYGDARVCGSALVYGGARVYGNALAYGDARVSRTPKVLSGFPYVVTVTDNHIAAGCERHPPSVWAADGEAIIRHAGYPAEAAEWAAIVNTIAKAHGCTDRSE